MTCLLSQQGVMISAHADTAASTWVHILSHPHGHKQYHHGHQRPVSLVRQRNYHIGSFSSTITHKIHKPPSLLHNGGGVSFVNLNNAFLPSLHCKSREINDGCVLQETQQHHKGDGRLEVFLAASLTVFFGVANRVFNKLALVPLKQYPFFLAQITTFGYVAVYFAMLYLRYRSGLVTKEMLALPQLHFLALGALEALGAASGMAAATMLPGASIPILSQTFLVWQLILSMIFLNRRYSANQIFGCLLISAGVVITVTSGAGAGKSLQQAGLFWPLLMILSFLFQAADTILKEFIFLDAAKKLKGGSLDLFVINSFGSGFQAIFILLLLPFLSRLWGIPFYQLPNYIKNGAACFVNHGSLSKECAGSPLLPLLFVFFNMGFNISLLHLLKISSAVVSSLSMMLSVPLSIYMFTLPLPFIGVDSTLPPGFVKGVVILVIGLIVYNFTQPTKTAKVH